MTFLAEKRKHAFILLLIALVIYFLDFWGIFAPLRYFTQRVILPLRKNCHRIRVISFDKIFCTREARLKEEVQILKEENSRLQGSLASLNRIKEENSRLRQLLDAPLDNDYRFLPLDVVKRKNGFLWVDGGQYVDQIKEGQLVVLGGQLVGEVVGKSGRQVKISLAFSAQFSHSVTIISSQQDCLREADLSCQLGQGVLEKDWVREILRDAEISAGDWVVLLNGPDDVIVGEVVQVAISSDKVFQEAKIKPILPEAFNSVLEVFLILNSDNE